MESIRTVLLLSILALLLLGCSAAEPDIEWDRDPSAVVLQFYSPYTTAGLSGAYDERYYVPEVRIWGDGRIVWVTQEGAGRRIMEGQLTEAQMEALMQRIVDAGFFEWEDSYYTPGGHSMSPMFLRVNLDGRSQEVQEHGGAPYAYYDLEALLLDGAGAEGQAYVPTQGYLTVRPLARDSGGGEWPAGTAVTPDEVGEGRYIEGEALAFAWGELNKNPVAPVYVSYEGETYVIMVQVPGISYFEPPPFGE